MSWLLVSLTGSQNAQHQKHSALSVCVPACMCVLDGDGSYMFASTVLAVVWMTVHLTG